MPLASFVRCMPARALGTTLPHSAASYPSLLWLSRASSANVFARVLKAEAKK